MCYTFEQRSRFILTKEKEELKQNLKRVAEKQGTQQAVSYEKLFNPQFMQQSTSFVSIDVFIKELGLKNFSDIEQLDASILTDFIKKETKFNSWEEMQQQAVGAYMRSLF